MQGFLISDTFYQMEYATPNHGIFALYDIGTWEIVVCKKYKEVSPVEVVLYFNELVKFFPWLIVKRFGIATESTPWTSNSHESLIEYFVHLVKSGSSNASIEFDLADIECNLLLNYKEKILSLKDKRAVNIYCYFDSERQRLSFGFYLRVDLFTSNPSRQPDVSLSDNEILFNRNLLANSLKAIEDSKVFTISNFSSVFHPELISKYGFA